MLQGSVWRCSDDLLPSSIEANIEGIGQIEVEVVYPFKPDACTVCISFGHKDQSCVKSKKVWRQKVPIATPVVGHIGIPNASSSFPSVTGTSHSDQSFGPGVAEADTVPDSSRVVVDGPSTPLTGSMKDNSTHLTVDDAAGLHIQLRGRFPCRVSWLVRKILVAWLQIGSPLENEEIFDAARGRAEGYPKRNKKPSTRAIESEEQCKKKKSITSELKGVSYSINST